MARLHGTVATLERLREVNLRISDPRGVPEADIRKLIGEGKAVICQSMSLHATEIGGSQMAPELAYDLKKCIGVQECGRCLTVCPEHALHALDSDGKVRVNWDLCTGCGRCVDACPVNVDITEVMLEIGSRS